MSQIQGPKLCCLVTEFFQKSRIVGLSYGEIVVTCAALSHFFSCIFFLYFSLALKTIRKCTAVGGFYVYYYIYALKGS